MKKIGLVKEHCMLPLMTIIFLPTVTSELFKEKLQNSSSQTASYNSITITFGRK